VGLSSSTRENVNFCSWNLEILGKNLKSIDLPEGIFRTIGTSFVIVHNKWKMEDLMCKSKISTFDVLNVLDSHDRHAKVVL
jgi:hypothetical protein